MKKNVKCNKEAPGKKAKGRRFKKRVYLPLLLFFSLLFVSTTLFRTQCAAWSVQYFAHAFFDTPLQYESLTYAEGKIVLDKPTLKHPSLGEWRASHIAIDLCFHPARWQMEASIVVDKPYFALLPNETKDFFLVSKRRVPFSPFHLQWDLAFEGGCIALPDFAPVPFQARFGNKAGGEGHAEITFSERETLSVSFFKNNGIWNERFQLDGTPLLFLMPLLQDFGVLPKGLLCRGGRAEAEATLQIQKEEVVLTWAKGGLYDVDMQHSRYPLALKGEMISFSLEDGCGEIVLEKPATFNLSGMSFFATSGGFQMGAGLVTSLSFQGASLATSVLSPFSVVTGSFGGKDLQATLTLYPPNRPHVEVACDFCRKEKGQVEFVFHFSNFTEEEASALLPFFGREGISLNRGAFSGDLSLYVSGHDLVSWKLSDLRGQNVSISQAKGLFSASWSSIKMELCGQKTSLYVQSDLREGSYFVEQSPCFSEAFLEVTAALSTDEEGALCEGRVIRGEERIDFGFFLPERSCELADLFSLPKSLRGGWFQGREITITPYFFGGQEVLEEFKTSHLAGTFDLEGCDVSFDLASLRLENPFFVFTMEEAKGGKHYFDFTKGVGYGFFPLQNASYFHKPSGLTASLSSANVHWIDRRATLTDIVATIEGVSFTANLSLEGERLEEGVFDLELYTDSFSGPIDKFTKLVSRINPLFSLPICTLQGDLKEVSSPSFFHIAFNPTGNHIDFQVGGKFEQTGLWSLFSDVDCKDLAFGFSYNHAKGVLDIHDVGGKILLGGVKEQEEFTLSADHITVLDIENTRSQFDVWMGDCNRDMVRLAGNSFKNKDGLMQFEFDYGKTHISHVHPRLFELTLQGGTLLQSLSLEVVLSLSETLKDFKRISEKLPGLFPGKLAQEISKVESAEGPIFLQLGYEGPSSLFQFFAKGEAVSVGEAYFQEIVLQGQKKGDALSIDQIKLGEISISADLQKKESSWDIPFLGLQHGKWFLLALEGEYIGQKQRFTGKVQKLVVNLGRLPEWQFLQNILKNLNCQGVLKGTGFMDLDFLTEENWVKVDTTLDLSLKELGLNDWKLKDAEHVFCHFVSDRGFTLGGMRTVLAYEGLELSSISLDRVDYDFSLSDFTLENVYFGAPCRHLPFLLEALQAQFPGTLEPSFAAALIQSRKEGVLSGSFSLMQKLGTRHLQLSLDEGAYTFLDDVYTVKSLILKKEPNLLSLMADVKLGDRFWPVRATFSSESFDAGEISFLEIEEKERGETPLTVSWTWNAEKGLVIHKVEGTFCGLDVKLRPISGPKGSLFFQGDVLVDGRYAFPLFSDSFKETLEFWKFGQGYGLSGKFSYDAAARKWEGFQGVLQGSHVECLGYTFDTLRADIVFEPKSLSVYHMRMEDPALVLIADHLYLKEKGNHWDFWIPSLSLSNFIPRNLKKERTLLKAQKEGLMIRRLELSDFKGQMGDENSYTGSGKIQFVYNEGKGEKAKPLLPLPKEAVSGFDLDLSLFSPQSGTIYYSIEEGKVLLTKFKDVYSKGKVSKFYLPKSTTPNFFDFDGNLFLQVQMKQNSLLLKLAEQYILTLSGALQAPSFAVTRQSLIASDD